MAERSGTYLEQQIHAQPAELERLRTDLAVRQQVHTAAEGLHRVRRIWVVGTGSSQHIAALGAAMLQDAGRSAHAVSSMQFVRNAPIVGPSDGVIIITHTGETAYALAARSLAFGAGLQTFVIGHRGIALSDVVETVDKEPSETYTVSYTSALLVFAMITAKMGAESLSEDALDQVPSAVAEAIAAPGIETVPAQARFLAIVGAGPSAITAAEGALKAREAARMLAAGYDAEYLLHGSAVPLTSEDHLVVLASPDEDGFVAALARAAEAERVGVTRLTDASGLPVLLAQIPMTVRLQLFAAEAARVRGTDPDTVITGAWADPGLWAIGAP